MCWIRDVEFGHTHRERINETAIEKLSPQIFREQIERQKCARLLLLKVVAQFCTGNFRFQVQPIRRCV